MFAIRTQGPTGSAAARELRGGGGSASVSNDMGTLFYGPSIDTEFSSETAIQEVLLSAGTVSNLRVYLTGAPGTGDSYVFTVRRDPAGAAGPSNTGITCTVCVSPWLSIDGCPDALPMISPHGMLAVRISGAQVVTTFSSCLTSTLRST